MVMDFILVVATGLWPVRARCTSRNRPQAVAQQSAPEYISELSRTRADSLRYFNCQLQCCRCLKPGYARRAASARAFDERGELAFERLIALDLDFVPRNPSPSATIDFTALISIIEREIRVLLKHANLAHALGTDAARRNVCHATILETQPRICDVFTAAQDRHPHRIDTLHRRTNEMQNDFQIMDHQIENHADIGA